MQPKIGDKFKLGPWTWTVANILSTSQFQAISNGIHDYKRYICLDVENADSLVWIKGPATISKAARDEIVKWIKNNGYLTSWATRGVNCVALEIKLASMVRDGE